MLSTSTSVRPPYTEYDELLLRDARRDDILFYSSSTQSFFVYYDKGYRGINILIYTFGKFSCPILML
jgi:hypothetical protein